MNATRLACIAAAAAAACAATTASADTMQFLLQDHPNGLSSPPPYGMRFDNLFASLGGAGTTSFSFNEYDDTILTVTTSGSDITINIAGTLIGGVDTGTGYGFGAGDYAINFTYTANVVASGSGWIVNDQTPVNNGTLTALGDNAGVAAGTVFNFSDKSDGNQSFRFLRDGYRLTAEQLAAFGNPWIGRGWVMAEGVEHGTHDFLFVGTLIPLPSAGLMAGLGIAGIAATRRRRA